MIIQYIIIGVLAAVAVWILFQKVKATLFAENCDEDCKCEVADLKKQISK